MTSRPMIVWRRSSTVAMTLMTAIGALSFVWPFFVSSDAALASGNDAPWLFPLLVALLSLVLIAELSSGGMDAKQVAVLGVLAAMGGALRVLSAGTAGLEPMFFLLVLGGRALGRAGGFLLGALAIVTGAFLTSGIGPWMPFQMFACGWVAMGASLLPQMRPRIERWMLTAYGFVASFAYGAVLNLWFWPFMGDTAPHGAGFDVTDSLPVQLRHYATFYGMTSLGWDLPRAVLTGALVLLACTPVLAALRRSMRRAAFDAAPTFDRRPARSRRH